MTSYLHAVGIGIIADAVMLIGGGALIGWQIVGVAQDVWGFAQFVNATTEEDLDKCGQHLANAISTVGIDIIIGILTKKAASKVKNSDEMFQPNLTRGDTPMSSELLENIKKKRI